MDRSPTRDINPRPRRASRTAPRVPTIQGYFARDTAGSNEIQRRLANAGSKENLLGILNATEQPIKSGEDSVFICLHFIASGFDFTPRPELQLEINRYTIRQNRYDAGKYVRRFFYKNLEKDISKHEVAKNNAGSDVKLFLSGDDIWTDVMYEDRGLYPNELGVFAFMTGMNIRVFQVGTDAMEYDFGDVNQPTYNLFYCGDTPNGGIGNYSLLIRNEDLHEMMTGAVEGVAADAGEGTGVGSTTAIGTGVAADAGEGAGVGSTTAIGTGVAADAGEGAGVNTGTGLGYAELLKQHLATLPQSAIVSNKEREPKGYFKTYDDDGNITHLDFIPCLLDDKHEILELDGVPVGLMLEYYLEETFWYSGENARGNIDSLLNNEEIVNGVRKSLQELKPTKKKQVMEKRINMIPKHDYQMYWLEEDNVNRYLNGKDEYFDSLEKDYVPAWALPLSEEERKQEEQVDATEHPAIKLSEGLSAAIKQAGLVVQPTKPGPNSVIHAVEGYRTLWSNGSNASPGLLECDSMQIAIVRMNTAMELLNAPKGVPGVPEVTDDHVRNILCKEAPLDLRDIGALARSIGINVNVWMDDGSQKLMLGEWSADDSDDDGSLDDQSYPDSINVLCIDGQYSLLLPKESKGTVDAKVLSVGPQDQAPSICWLCGANAKLSDDECYCEKCIENDSRGDDPHSGSSAEEGVPPSLPPFLSSLNSNHPKFRPLKLRVSPTVMNQTMTDLVAQGLVSHHLTPGSSYWWRVCGVITPRIEGGNAYKMTKHLLGLQAYKNLYAAIRAAGMEIEALWRHFCPPKELQIRIAAGTGNWKTNLKQIRMHIDHFCKVCSGYPVTKRFVFSQGPEGGKKEMWFRFPDGTRVKMDIPNNTMVIFDLHSSFALHWVEEGYGYAVLAGDLRPKQDLPMNEAQDLDLQNVRLMENLGHKGDRETEKDPVFHFPRELNDLPDWCPADDKEGTTAFFNRFKPYRVSTPESQSKGARATWKKLVEDQGGDEEAAKNVVGERLAKGREAAKMEDPDYEKKKGEKISKKHKSNVISKFHGLCLEKTANQLHQPPVTQAVCIRAMLDDPDAKVSCTKVTRMVCSEGHHSMRLVGVTIDGTLVKKLGIRGEQKLLCTMRFVEKGKRRMCGKLLYLLDQKKLAKGNYEVAKIQTYKEWEGSKRSEDQDSGSNEEDDRKPAAK